MPGDAWKGTVIRDGGRCKGNETLDSQVQKQKTVMKNGGESVEGHIYLIYPYFVRLISNRRKKLGKNGISCFFLFLAFLFLPSLCPRTGASFIGENKQDVVEHILNQLTPEEVSRIFGQEKSNQFVPNLDIVRPIRSNDPQKRRKRSPHDPSSISELKSEAEKETQITLQGLGRNFNISLSPNPNLIDSHNFVYLIRDQNGSQVLTETPHLQRQLRCFYHGKVSHAPTADRHQSPTSAGIGSAALDVCGGIRGFLISPDSQEDHHYVIHPMPARLHGTHHAQEQEPVTLDTQHHFLWRRDNPLANLNAHFSQNAKLQSLQSCRHDDSIPHIIRKRSPQTTLGDDSPKEYGSYVYRPRSVPSDSYWIQHRTPKPSQVYIRNNAREVRRKPRGNPAEAAPTEDSEEFHWAESQKATETDVFYYTQQPTARQVGANQPTAIMLEEENIFNQNPSENLPFLTRRTEQQPETSQRFDTNSRYSWSEHRPEESRSYEPTRNRNSFYGSRNQSRVLPSDFQDTQWVTQGNGRKGRNDEEIFGPNWKSSLDTDLSWTEQPAADSTGALWVQSRKEAGESLREKEPSHLTIETAVFIDKDLFKHMKSNFPDDTHGEVTRIVLAMINAVQLLYQDPSLGHRVDFVLKRLEVLISDPPGLLRPYDIDRFLTNFCKWQKTENPTSDADPLHWDHALILTGLDLYVVHQSGKISNQVVGLAPVAGMCTRSSSCTVNEGRHFESVYVVAHEIGHNLGMRHDGPQADNECDPTSHIMSPTLGSGKITWSPCSKRYLDMFLETSQSKCLLDRAKSESRLDHDADGRLPGERFDADRQCVLKYGRGSYHAIQQPLEDVCRDLHCRREHYTWTSHPALEGTFCGIDMWCRAGKCVAKSNSISAFDHTSSINSVAGSETAAYSTLKAMNGGWGKWSLFTDCSSACLTSDDGLIFPGSTGVRLAARRCDSPRPENGGRQCEGPDRRYKTCDAAKVCAATPTRPKTTEYANEVCARAAVVDTELTGRGYMTNTNDPERACSVWCETNEKGGSRSRGWSFPDGTACKLISQPNAPTFCIAGKCQEFTCDANSYFSLSEEECVGLSKELAPKSWFGHRLDVPSSSSSVSSSSSTSITKSTSVLSSNHRSPKAGWTSWESQSECKLACLAPSKGLELVKRECNAGDNQCSGLALSVRLCKPSTATALTCHRLQTPFEYATKVCSKYSEKVSGLSGIGMQLSATSEDKDRPCRIGCQDEGVPYRFYMVNGEEGWFPAGTDCSRGDLSKKAYCMGGKCIDFGLDDTPTYRITEKLMGTLDTIFQQRNKRQIVYDVMDAKSTHAALDQGSLRDLINQFPQSPPSNGGHSYFFGHHADRPQDIRPDSLDFSRPITIDRTISREKSYSHENRGSPSSSGAEEDNKSYRGNGRSIQHEPDSLPDSSSVRGVNANLYSASVETKVPSRIGSSFWSSGPIEGSFYEWRMILSDCSVSCGKGVLETIVQCISGETVVADSLCNSRPRPGVSGYSDCYRHKCENLRRSDIHNSLWDWVQSLLPKRDSHS